MTPKTLATTHSRDFLDRLVSIDSSTGAGAVSSHAYTHDLLGRRTAAERQDGSRWDYAYDEDGQLLSASRQWPDAAPVAGQQFAYAYDGIGNRTAATVNGRESIHTSNTLNQYTQRTVPGALDVRGGVPATRQGDYFHRAVPVDNADAPQHPQIKVRAFGPGIGPGGADLKTGETTGRAYLPQTPETFSHDLDGNLTEDGRWVYTWDAENRLIAMESAPSVPDTAKRKLEFAYDFQGRRIRKRVHDWDGTAYVLADERRYAYDGWNLVAEIVASPTPFVRTYVWGLDLSGTEQGAGGVGGLLAIQENGESHYPAYDGNGNVMALVRGSDGAVSGRYEYGPFGELLEVEEDGIANPFRFSTKFQDAETGLLYYGYRYYDPGTGRWLNRDPIGERGGVNLYGFVRNRPTNRVDYLGLACIKEIIVIFDRADTPQLFHVDANGRPDPNRPVELNGRIFYGTLCAYGLDGTAIQCWSVTSGGSRASSSPVFEGHDTAVPSGDYNVETKKSGGTQGYLIRNTGLRSLIKIHGTSGVGSDGCVVFPAIGELDTHMTDTREKGKKDVVPISIRHYMSNGEDPPRGNQGAGIDDPVGDLPGVRLRGHATFLDSFQKIRRGMAPDLPWIIALDWGRMSTLSRLPFERVMRAKVMSRHPGSCNIS